LLPAPLRKTLDEATRYISATVLIGPKGSLSNLHVDFLHTHSYLAQILGRKRCVLFSPHDSTALYDGKVDLDLPDFERFPLFRDATAFECTLEPGEVLFTPHRWWHHVVGLEKSITIAYNFFNRVNFSDYLADLLQRLPAIVDGLDACPDARAALGIEWLCRGFELPAHGLK
jgi:ribosomal protein L16 Arg81 hydroxylase